MLKFSYKKKSGEVRDVRVHPLTYDEKAIEGIDTERLTKEQLIYLEETLKTYQECIDHLMKTAYRRFLHTGIVSDVETEEN